MVAVIVPWFLLPAAIISWLYLQYSILYVSRNCRSDRSAKLINAVEGRTESEATRSYRESSALVD